MASRTDFRVALDTWDIELTADGRDVQLLELAADEPELIKCDCGQMLATNAGEWAWDTEFGLPYLSVIFQTGISLATIEGIIRTKLLERPGVTSVPAMSLAPIPAQRRLSGWVDVRYRTGTVVRVTL